MRDFTRAIVVFGALFAASCGVAKSEPSASREAPAPPATVPAASPTQAASDTPVAVDSALTDAEEQSMLKPWVGDLDGMVERRYVRILCSFNRTNYFLDKAQQRGLTYE